LKKHILEVIEDEMLIKNLYHKVQKVKKKVIYFNNKINKSKNKLYGYIFLGLCIYPSYLLFSLIYNSNFEVNTVSISYIALIFFTTIIFNGGLSLILRNLIIEKTNKPFKLNKKCDLEKQFLHSKTTYNQRLTNFLLTFEKTLLIHEADYLKNWYLSQYKDEDAAYYNILSWGIYNSTPEILISNMELISFKIKDKFNLEIQEKLFNSIQEVIEKGKIKIIEPPNHLFKNNIKNKNKIIVKQI